MALQVVEKQAKEDLLSEINRLQTMHHLELGNVSRIYYFPLKEKVYENKKHIFVHKCLNKKNKQNKKNHILTSTFTNERSKRASPVQCTHPDDKFSRAAAGRWEWTELI